MTLLICHSFLSFSSSGSSRLVLIAFPVSLVAFFSPLFFVFLFPVFDVFNFLMKLFVKVSFDETFFEKVSFDYSLPTLLGFLGLGAMEGEIGRRTVEQGACSSEGLGTKQRTSSCQGVWRRSACVCFYVLSYAPSCQIRTELQSSVFSSWWSMTNWIIALKWALSFRLPIHLPAQRLVSCVSIPPQIR